MKCNYRIKSRRKNTAQFFEMISVKKSTKSNQASKLTDCKTSNLMEHETSYISPDLLIIQKLKEDEIIYFV